MKPRRCPPFAPCGGWATVELETNMNMKQACEIVYAGMSIGQDTCRHEWYQGKCIHCNLTADWGHAVRELNAKLGVEHNRTVEAERKNKRLLAEVERLTMELNALTNGEYTKQDIELERLRTELGESPNDQAQRLAVNDQKL